MAVEAGARLRTFGNPLRRLLIAEHVGVPAGFAVIETEGVARVETLEPGIGLELAGRQGARTAMFGFVVVDRATIGIELEGPIHAPRFGIGGGFVNFDEANEGGSRFLAML